MLFSKLIEFSVIKNILDKLADSYTIDCLNMLDQLKIKIIQTALAEHATSYKHSFDFKNTKILDTENILKKRLFLEMTYIQRENSSVNYKTDIENLSAIYNKIIKSIK